MRYSLCKARPNMLTPAEREALGTAIYAYRHAPDVENAWQNVPNTWIFLVYWQR